MRKHQKVARWDDVKFEVFLIFRYALARYLTKRVSDGIERKLLTLV